MVHARVTGPRGPRAGRRSRLAGPRPGTGVRGWTGPASTTSRPSRKSTRTTPRSPRRSWPRSAKPPPMSCSRSRRPAPGGAGPGQPGSARVFPGESSSPAAAFGPGMVFDVLPGCAQLAVAADAAAEDDRFAGVLRGRAGRRAVRVGPGRGPRRGPQARRDRRAGPAEPRPEDAEFTADQIANALGESRFRADELTGTAGHLDTHLPGTKAALRDGIAEPGQGPADRHCHRPARSGRGPRRRGRRCWTGPGG